MKKIPASITNNIFDDLLMIDITEEIIQEY